MRVLGRVLISCAVVLAVYWLRLFYLAFCGNTRSLISAELERDVPLRVVVDLDLAEAEGEEKGEEVWLSR